MSDSESFTNDGQLSCVGQDCLKIPPTIIQTYGPQTKRLDLSFNSLRTLDGLDRFTVLEELVLDNNNLDDNVQFCFNFSMHTLSLNKNKLVNIEKLLDQIARCYPNLSYLSLLGNPACPDQLSSSEKDDEDYQRYRYYAIYRLPKLNFLDSTSVKINEKREAKRVGEFMRIVRPVEQDAAEEVDDDVIDAARFNPLPNSSSTIGSHKGAYGVLRYRYSGKHSEGNRFIRNHEL